MCHNTKFNLLRDPKTVELRVKLLIDENPTLRNDKNRLFVEYRRIFENKFWNSEHEKVLEYLNSGVPYTTIDRAMRKV